jgi:hypothetical protein
MSCGHLHACLSVPRPQSNGSGMGGHVSRMLHVPLQHEMVAHLGSQAHASRYDWHGKGHHDRRCTAAVPEGL